MKEVSRTKELRRRSIRKLRKRGRIRTKDDERRKIENDSKEKKEERKSSRAVVEELEQD